MFYKPKYPNYIAVNEFLNWQIRGTISQLSVAKSGQFYVATQVGIPNPGTTDIVYYEIDQGKWDSNYIPDHGTISKLAEGVKIDGDGSDYTTFKKSNYMIRTKFTYYVPANGLLKLNVPKAITFDDSTIPVEMRPITSDG